MEMSGTSLAAGGPIGPALQFLRFDVRGTSAEKPVNIITDVFFFLIVSEEHF